MHKFIHAFAVTLIMSFVICGPALALETAKGTFSQQSGAMAVEAQSYQKTNQHKKAVKVLRNALKLDGLTAYESSAMNQMLGASYYARGSSKKAIRAFAAAIDAGGLDAAGVSSMKANIAQLNILEKNYSLGAAQLEAHFKEGGEQTEKLIRLLIQAHIQAENPKGAVPWAQLMLDGNVLSSRKDYDTALYLFDSPEHRVSQMKVANKMQKLWPTDKTLLFKVAILRGKAQKEGIGAIVIAGKTEVVDTAKKADYSNVSFQEAKPILRIPGYMPAGANKSGHCKVIFDVTETGTVSNIRVKSCSDPIFQPPSLKAIKQWVYSPKIINGNPAVSPNIEQTVRYIMRNAKGEKLPE